MLPLGSLDPEDVVEQEIVNQRVACLPMEGRASAVSYENGKLTGMVLQDERLRTYRAVEVLELIGTLAAREILQALADGAPGALLTTSAKAALHR